MSDSQVALEDIGQSKILSAKQRRWLDGDKEALQGTPERKIWYKIRNRVKSGYTEMRFIHERMPAEQLQKIGRNGDNSVIGLQNHSFDGDVAKQLQGTARTMAATAGMEGSVDMIEEGMEGTQEGDNSAKMVAKVVAQIFNQRGIHKDNYSQEWEKFASDVEKYL